MNAIDPSQIEPDALESCELCGCVIEDLEELIYLRAADLIAQWERADPRDAWRHTGEHPPRSTEPVPPARAYRIAESTEHAFWFVVSLNDPERLKAWMRDHPKDAPTLLKLLENK